MGFAIPRFILCYLLNVIGNEGKRLVVFWDYFGDNYIIDT